MKRELGIAYCGLACCLCHENTDCKGCKSGDENLCKSREWCKNLRCCQEKGLAGCWECRDFPCEGSTVSSPRVRAFARYLREYGEAALLDSLERNEKAGIVYHDPGQITGDYDRLDNEEAVFALLLKDPIEN